MDFYSRQAAARGQSRWLVIGFMLSLLAVALALDVVLFTFLSTRSHSGSAGIGPLQFAAANPGLAFTSTLLVVGVLGLASLYKSMELRGGGGVVARSLGGVLVASDTTDIQRKRLLNVVSEMAIASGVPMPEVYVLEQEAGINAFAAGHTPANAAVTVTQGALDRLSRDQLQGVIGHEFSHILNGDMRLNVQLMGWVFGLFVVALIGRLIVNFTPRSDDRRNSNSAFLALGFAVMALGYVGLFLGRLMQAAVSRQRERLADASGVQFTRNPDGLKGALIKIAATEEGSTLRAPQAEQAAHMFFADGMQRFFATHPPLLERIRELDPKFDTAEISRVAQQLERTGGHDSSGWNTSGSALNPQSAASQPGLGGAPVAGFASSMTGAAAPRQTSVSSLAGTVDASHIQHAQALHAALPDELRNLQTPGRAQAFVLALLLSRDVPVRQRQLELLSQATSLNNTGLVQQLAPLADALDPMLRLPALQQVFPLLRRVPVEQRRNLGRLASILIHADASIDPFEFSLAKLLESLLEDEMSARTPHGSVSLESAQQEITLLLATLAQLGASDAASAQRAYEAGMTVVLPMREPQFSPVADWQRQLSDALPRLDQLDPRGKKTLIDGLVKTIAADDVLTEAESELLRLVCALLHCPLPPLLGGPAL